MTEFIAPSKHDPWAGGCRDGVGPLTDAQRIKGDAMRARVPSHVGGKELPVLYRVSVTLEPKIGDNGMPGHAYIVCPVIGARKDGTKLLVIAPDGSDQWVAWK